MNALRNDVFHGTADRFLTGLVLKILVKIALMQDQQNRLLTSEQVWTCTTLFLTPRFPASGRAPFLKQTP
ncbi:hypothetical protein AFAE65S_03201 [Alcaligenes phenolicus]